MMNRCYKVVTSGYYSLIGRGGYQVQYVLNELIEAPTVNGIFCPLLVFDTLEHAKDFIDLKWCNVVILKGHARDMVKCNRVSPWMTSQDFSDYWNGYSDRYRIAPKGTYICDAVKLTEAICIK